MNRFSPLTLRASLVEWFRADDQELLRREVAWTLRWMRRPFPLIGIVFIILVQVWMLIGPRLFLDRENDFLGASQSTNVGFGMVTITVPLSLIAGLISIAMWWTLLHRRTLLPMHSQRLRDIVISPLSPWRIWPALLVPPVMIFLISAPIEVALSLSLNVFDLISGKVVLPPLFGGEIEQWGYDSNARWLTVGLVSFLYGILGPILALLTGALATSAVTAFVAWFVIPRNGSFNVILALVLVLLAFYSPYILIGIVYVLISINSLLRSALPGPALPAPFFLNPILITIIPMLISLAISSVILFLSLRSLRGERKWEKLREHAARM